MGAERRGLEWKGMVLLIKESYFKGQDWIGMEGSGKERKGMVLLINIFGEAKKE